MAPGSNERHTGTVPKSKIRNNCKVPQEAVTPTRRDMNNTNLISSSLDWVPVSEHNSRSNYNRSQNQTASQSESDYGDLETVMAFEGNSGRFVPVRPQPRILPLSSPQNHRDITYDHNEDLNSTSSTNHLNHYSHTNMNAQHTNHGAAAVMIVNPTTPNSVCSNGTYQFNLQNASANSSRNNGPRSFNSTRNMHNGIPGQGMLNNNHTTSNTHSSNMKSNNLLNNGSDNTQNSSASGSEVSQVHNESSRSIADAMVEACPDTAQVEHRLGQIREYIRVTSTLVDSMRNSEDEEIIVRPMSVQSTGSAYSDNELWQNELKAKMEISQQRLAALQEQQKRLLKYQAEAKKQLAEISANRSRPLIGTEISANQSSPPVLQESSSSPRMFPNTFSHHSNYNQSSSSSNTNVNRTFTSNQVGVATTLPHITEYQQNMNQLYSSDEQAAVNSGTNDIPLEAQISGLSNLINSQLVDSEEEGDPSLNQHEILRNKLRELQRKKQHMENLVAEFQSLQANVWPQKGDKNEDKASSSRLINARQEQHPNSSSDESGTDDRFHQSDGRNDVENQKSEDTWKIMEVTAMKAKLEKLHEIMRTVDNIENRLSTSVLHDEQQPEEHNLNRQDSCKWEDDRDSNKSARLQNQITPSKLTNERSNSGIESNGINISTLQQLTQQMRREAMSISDQRKRQRNLSSKESQPKFPDKKVNAESEARKSKGKSCPGPLEKKQIALKAELEEKKRELEALLNKQSENNSISDMDTQDAGSVAGPSRRSSNAVQRANQHSHIKDHGESDSFISGMQMDMRAVKCRSDNGSVKDNVDEDGDGQATSSHASTPEPYRVDSSLVVGAGASLDTLLLPSSSPTPLGAPPAKNKPSVAPKRNDFESQSAATKSSHKTCTSWRNRQQSMGSLFGENDNCGLCGQTQCIANQPASAHQPNSDGGQTRNQHMENYWWNDKSNQDHRTNQFTQNSHSQTMDQQMMISQPMPYPPYPYNMMMPYAGMMPAAPYLPPPVMLPPDAWWGRTALTQCCQQIHAQNQEIATLRNSISSLETRYETLMNNLMSNMVGAHPTCNLPNAAVKPPAPPPHDPTPEVPQLCPPTQQPIFNNRMPFPIQHPNILNNQQQQGPQVIQNDMNSNYPGGSQHTASPRSSPGTALNNQVPPGNRANNYWDNFRSYSRQNLLSNSSKANAEGHASNVVATHGAHPLVERSHNSLAPPPTAPKRNTEASRDQRRRRNHQPFHTNNADTHNQYQNFHSDQDWPSSSNAPRGTEMASNVFNSPVNLNVNRDSVLSERNLNVSLLPTAAVQDANINLSNSDSTDKRKSSSKLPAKNSASSTNYAAGYGQSRNLDLNGGSEVSNLNLASTDSNGTRDKSTSKLFDLLRENVYSEVTALISANESHPHFLIQLFRDLQQISSEPLRQRALRSIRNVSNGFGDSRIADEFLPPRNDAPLSSSYNSQCGEDPEGMDSIIRSDMDMKIIEFVTAHGTEMCTADLLDILANVILDIANESGRPNLYSGERLRACLAIFEGRKLCDIGNELLLNISLLPTNITPVRTAILEEEIPRLPSDGSDSSIMQEVAGALSMFSNITSSSHLNRTFSNVECNATQSESQFLDSTRLETSNDDFNAAGTSGLKSTPVIEEAINIYNGDLAEADQTQHRENEQTSGQDNVDMTLEVATNAPIEENTPTEAEAEWLGLDRVPTRLHFEDGSGNQTD